MRACHGALVPRSVPANGKARRRFTFEYRSILYTVLYTFDGELVMLHDIHFSRRHVPRIGWPSRSLPCRLFRKKGRQGGIT